MREFLDLLEFLVAGPGVIIFWPGLFLILYITRPLRKPRPPTSPLSTSTIKAQPASSTDQYEYEPPDQEKEMHQYYRQKEKEDKKSMRDGRTASEKWEDYARFWRGG